MREPWAENPEAWKGGPSDAEMAAAFKRLRRQAVRVEDSFDILTQRMAEAAAAFAHLIAALKSARAPAPAEPHTQEK